MDTSDLQNITFLDLSEEAEETRQEINQILFDTNTCVELPWNKGLVKSKQSIERSIKSDFYINCQPSEQVHQQPIFQSPQFEYNFYVNQQSDQFNHLPASSIYPQAINFQSQPQYYFYHNYVATTTTSLVPNNIYATPLPIINHNFNGVQFLNSPPIPDYIQPIQPTTFIPSNCLTALPPNINPIQNGGPIFEHNSNELQVEQIAASPPAEPILSPHPEPDKNANHIIRENQICTEKIVKASIEAIQPVKETPLSANVSNGKPSWASLFGKSATNSTGNNGPNVTNAAVNYETNNNFNNEETCPIKNPRKQHFIDPNLYRMGEYLLSYTIECRTSSLQPRGLINRSNYCYVNSILQALLACPPLYNLLSELFKEYTIGESKKTPVIDSMCRFVKEFKQLLPGQRVRRNDKNTKKDLGGITIDYDLPFEANWMYRMLNGTRSDSFLVEGRQEDAEEFLGCLLNGLNDEMLELMKLVKGDLNIKPVDESMQSENTDEWQVMGPRNKGSITRLVDYVKTPISNIFGGSLKSKIHRTGDHVTSNIQPFFTLPLNIKKVKSVTEALEALVTKNQLEGVTSVNTNEAVEAWQQVTLEELPVILILHLKCFDYMSNGCTKIVKALEFPIDLKIDSKLLSSQPTTLKEKQYKLFAVVYHDGKEATKGHYITDAFHVGYSSWIRYDDATVRLVQEEQVLKPQGSCVPYLLFYRRSDKIRNK